MSSIKVGVDIGGTFTDAIAIFDSGKIVTAKALTTAGKLSEGVISAIENLKVKVHEIDYFVHGTTAGLNAFLERRGANVALITTLGFRDVYEIGRASRPDMYNLKYRPPKPLISRKDIFEINERIGADGVVLREVAPEDIDKLVTKLESYDAIAIVLLHAYKNSVHEAFIADYLGKELPGKTISCSHVIAPEWREFERTSTTAISAYIAPIINEYLSDLGIKLTQIGLTPDVKVMQSNGGVISAETAKIKPIQTLFSGPVGGTIAGVEIGIQLNLNKLICVDMGGTSFDVSLVVDKKADIEIQTVLEGHPILSPAVSMKTIGAGGGSIAFSSFGSLRVGPRSSGANPGPACYGRGGTEPTVTDANVFLGRLPNSVLLAGNMLLDRHLAESALSNLGKELNLSTEETAEGILRVVNASMANAIRELTVSRGIDPRDYTLVAFGGAGPLHAVEIAEHLQLTKVIVPLNPGVLSAWGMLHADSRLDSVMSYFINLKSLDEIKLQETLSQLSSIGIEGLLNASILLDNIITRPAADLRYRGQEYTVTIEWPTQWSAREIIQNLGKLFEEEHLIRYGHNNEGEEIEIVNIRVGAIGITKKNETFSIKNFTVAEEIPSQKVFFTDDWAQTSIIRRENIKLEVEIKGPAIIVENDCTTTLPPGWKAELTEFGHLILEKND